MSPADTVAAPTRVLVVDDSSFSRRTLRLLLESMGLSVEEASNGAEALERFYINAPALVLLDLVMPDMTGNEVLAKFHELNPAVPVIIATSDLQAATADDVRAAGAVALINKPITRTVLETTVRAALAGGNSWS